MATIGTDRTASTGNLPPIDGTAAGNNPAAFRISPETYTTVDSLIKTTKDFVMPNLVETYGDQGITGFLKLTGAINAGGQSDQIDWWEMGRRHKTLAYTAGNTTIGASGVNVTITDSAVTEAVQAQDVLMDVGTGARFIVKSGGFGTGSAADVVLIKLDGTAAVEDTDIDASAGGTLIKIGNMYAQGTNQPTAFDEPGVRRYSNPFMIVKDRYEVNGSQATNIGWVNIGGGEYRWFMKGEQEARARFEDRRELMMLFGEKNDGSGAQALDDNLAGSEGYFSAIQDRGIQVSNANANPLDSFSEFDDIIMELDKQGAPSEYAMYVNRKQDLAIDDMLATGLATSVTAGLPGQFGAFNNDADMAVKLGFKSFTRGGYTFHKHDWKLLNDPTLLGASNFIQGAMIPMTQVADARSGMKAPALAMYYKEANGYSREMEHWVTGSILGHTNNGDVGSDNAVFHYRSEIALCVRGANQHVMIKG
tara:strand:+ start:2298 stop:3731 length:1434 start_codon:yes stop_codon:yes gene_type:complete